MSWEVLEADCLDAMREMDEASVDAIVTDPPYGINFMGKAWDGAAISEAARRNREGFKGGKGTPQPSRSDGDKARAEGKLYAGIGSPAATAGQYDLSPTGLKAFQAWSQAWATEALRVLKPGGHLLAFGGTRTYHRLACAVEDAGFEIRDSVIWLYGSGFPKSLAVDKAIDRAAGAEREIVGQSWEGKTGRTALGQGAGWNHTNDPEQHNITAPATPEAQRWQGWGTALKPAHEPIVVARKPLVGTVAQNVSEFGTGALNVDGTRIGFQGKADKETVQGATWHMVENDVYGDYQAQSSGEKWSGADSTPDTGRWPANVCLSHIGPDENGEGGCEPVGTRRVKGHAGYPNGPGGKSMHYSDQEGRGADVRPEAWAGHADPDGLETVTEWRCATDEHGRNLCPVAELDRQSGELKSPKPYERGSEPLGNPRIYGMGAGIPQWSAEGNYGDVGGASRFFATFNDQEERHEQAVRGRSPGAMDEGEPGGSRSGQTALHSSAASEAQGDTRAETQKEGHTLNCDLDEDCSCRFRYVAKASRAERNAGLEGFEEREAGIGDERLARNVHPTVKPIALMRWLCRLVTPPGGVLLDPFVGSGTTGCAAVLEGFDFIGIEREAEYVAISRARIAWWEQHRGREADEVLALSAKSERERAEHEDAGQMGLWSNADVGGGALSSSEQTRTAADVSTRKPSTGRSIYGDYGEAVVRCPEHGDSIPSGSTSYRCGCPIQRGEPPRRAVA